jgi:putative Holliday junction resolvase
MPEAQARVALAFDFGLRRIGVASGDTVSATAAPCGSIRVTSTGIDWTEVERLLQRFSPAVLVVGSPRNADGTAGRLAPAADRFAAALAARSQRPVHRADEYASSFEAGAELALARARGQRRRRLQRADMDSAAAAIILERWLRGEGRIND